MCLLVHIGNFTIILFILVFRMVWQAADQPTYSSKILPFSSFIQQYKRYLLVNQTEFFCDFFTIIFSLIIYLIYFNSYN